MATRGQVDARDSRTMAIQFDQGKFEEGREELTQCAERLGHYIYLTGNEITEETVLSVIGPKAYKLLGNLMFQKKDRQSVGFVAYGNTNRAFQPIGQGMRIFDEY